MLKCDFHSRFSHLLESVGWWTWYTINIHANSDHGVNHPAHTLKPRMSQSQVLDLHLWKNVFSLPSSFCVPSGWRITKIIRTQKRPPASVPSRDHYQLNCKSLQEKLQLLRNLLGAVCKTNWADHGLCKGVTTIYIKVCLKKVDQRSKIL